MIFTDHLVMILQCIGYGLGDRGIVVQFPAAGRHVTLL